MVIVRSGAGAEADGIVVTKPQGAHPGGTAGIGRTVDADLRTAVDGLYVCDASVLPEPAGKPPILTVVALAKRFEKALAGEVAAGEEPVGAVGE